MVQVLDKLVVLLPKDGLQQVDPRGHQLVPASSSGGLNPNVAALVFGG
jgi:hypothetical protein